MVFSSAESLSFPGRGFWLYQFSRDLWDRARAYSNLSWIDCLTSTTFNWSFSQMWESWQNQLHLGLSLWIDQGRPLAVVLWSLPVVEELEIWILARKPDVTYSMQEAFSLWLKEFQRRGVQSIYLEVHERNIPARHFYEKMRFYQSGKRSGYYPDGGSALLYAYNTSSK